MKSVLVPARRCPLVVAEEPVKLVRSVLVTCVNYLAPSWCAIEFGPTRISRTTTVGTSLRVDDYVRR